MYTQFSCHQTSSHPWWVSKNNGFIFQFVYLWLLTWRCFSFRIYPFNNQKWFRWNSLNFAHDSHKHSCGKSEAIMSAIKWQWRGKITYPSPSISSYKVKWSMLLFSFCNIQILFGIILHGERAANMKYPCFGCIMWRKVDREWRREVSIIAWCNREWLFNEL